MTVSQDDILDALRQAMRPAVEGGEAGATTGELAAAMRPPVSSLTMRKYLHGLIASGRAVAVKVHRPRMDGTMTIVSAYRLTDHPAPTRHRG
jgi:hypothetical protein